MEMMSEEMTGVEEGRKGGRMDGERRRWVEERGKTGGSGYVGLSRLR